MKDDKLLYSGPLINEFKVDISGKSAVLMLQTPIRISLETYCFDRDRSHPVRFIVVKDDKSCENLSRQGEKFDFSDFMPIKEIIEQNFGNVASLSVKTLSEIGFNLP